MSFRGYKTPFSDQSRLGVAPGPPPAPNFNFKYHVVASFAVQFHGDRPVRHARPARQCGRGPPGRGARVSRAARRGRGLHARAHRRRESSLPPIHRPLFLLQPPPPSLPHSPPPLPQLVCNGAVCPSPGDSVSHALRMSSPFLPHEHAPCVRSLPASRAPLCPAATMLKMK